VSEDFTFFFGVASGSSRKALRKMEEPNIMVNYATQNNGIWEGIDNLMIDSGGYSFMKGKGEYETSDEDYLSYIYEHQPEYFVLRDYPCEPDLLKKLGRSVEKHQKMTIEKHIKLLDIFESWGKNIQSQPVPVVQGYEVVDYLNHLDQLKEHGLIRDYLAIGSLCNRGSPNEIRRIILTIRREISSHVKLHGFGVKKSVLKYSDILESLNSADSLAYDPGGNTIPGEESFISGDGSKTWKDAAYGYLELKKTINKFKNRCENETGTQAGLAEFERKEMVEENTLS